MNSNDDRKRSGFPSQRWWPSSAPDRHAERSRLSNCHRVGVCNHLVLADSSEATRSHQASTKVFATPVLVIASQACTRLSIILQRKNIDALLTAMNPLVREFLAACAEEVPPVARCGEVPPADCPPRAVEGRILSHPL